MSFTDEVLAREKPKSVRQDLTLPRHQRYYPSPVNWRDEILYFLLVDRFSDGKEKSRPLLDRTKPELARPALPDGSAWRWDLWSQSGGDRWQGGTIKGVESKLDYLKKLGISTIWLSPIFKQRGHLNTYHGYGIQDFLDVDPRFGTRKELVNLIKKAHSRDMRIILDIIFNHSGANWIYPNDEWKPPYKKHPYQYAFGKWLSAKGKPSTNIAENDDGVWPEEFQATDCYTRAGKGDLGKGDISDPYAEHKRTDFEDLRDFQLGSPETLANLALCYKYWIALTDCDGFRIDTLKHVSYNEARNFCGSIKEFAANMGKHNFFLVGEIAGGDYAQDRYLDTLSRNMNAALDIGEMRIALNGVAKGLAHPLSYFGKFNPQSEGMGSHRFVGDKHVSILDDHDHVCGEKIRYSSDASSPNQVIAGVGLQLFTLGIPCIYYGTEQAFSGPESSERKWLKEWGKTDRYLREAMFGPMHPLKNGLDGMKKSPACLDTAMPGFGPFGTAGHHCFDDKSDTFKRISVLTKTRSAYPALRYGRQYLRQISFDNKAFEFYGPGEILAWSRILDDEEILCVLNSHGTEMNNAHIVVDAKLNPAGNHLTVICNTSQAVKKGNYTGSHPVGSTVTVKTMDDGTAYVEIGKVGPSEIILLSNFP